jgi:hypothetical protein
MGIRAFHPGLGSTIGVRSRQPRRRVLEVGDRNPEVGSLDAPLLANQSPTPQIDPTAFREPQGGSVEPLLGALGTVMRAADTPGREFIREPLSAAMTYASMAEAEGIGFGDWFNRRRWREAYETAQDRSIGQSVALAFLSSGDEGNRVTDEDFLMLNTRGLVPSPWMEDQRSGVDSGPWVEQGWLVHPGKEKHDAPQEWWQFGLEHAGKDPTFEYKGLSAIVDAAFRMNPIDPLNFGLRALIRLGQRGSAALGRTAVNEGVSSGQLMDPGRFYSLEDEAVDVKAFLDDMRSGRPDPDVYQQYADIVVDGVTSPNNFGDNTIWTRDVLGLPTVRPWQLSERIKPRGGWGLDDLWNRGPKAGGSGYSSRGINHYLEEAGAHRLSEPAHVEHVAALVANDLQEIVVRSVDAVGVGSTMPLLRTQIRDSPIGPSASTAPPTGSLSAPGRHLPWAQQRQNDILEMVVDPRKDILASFDARTVGGIGEREVLLNPATIAANTVRSSPSMAEAVFGPGLHSVPPAGQAANQSADDFIQWLLTNEWLGSNPVFQGVGSSVSPQAFTAAQADLLEAALLEAQRRG